MRAGFLVCLMGAATLGGCGTIIKDRSLEPASPVGGYGAVSGSYTPKGSIPSADVVTLDLPALIWRYVGDPQPKTIEEALADFDKASFTPDQRLEYRNDIVAAILMASEKNCEVYLEYLHGNQVAVRTFSSVFATLFSGAAAVTTPAASARILAALGSASSGVGGNIDQAAFSKLAAETIAAGVRADQAEGVLALRAKLSGSSYKEWPLAFAIRDALEIHDRCDAVSALGYLQGTALQKADAANKGVSSPPPDATTPPATGTNAK